MPQESGGGASISNDRVTCQKIGGGQVDLWTLTVSEGFAENHPVTAELLEVMKAFACAPKVEAIWHSSTAR